MKKVFLSIFAILALVVVAQAAAPTRVAVDAPYEWEYVTGSTTTTSITGVDSATLTDKYRLQFGYEYIFVVKDSIAAAGDSVGYRMDVYGNDGTTVMGSTKFATSLTAAGPTQWIFPIGETLVGSKVKIKALRYNVTTVSKVKIWELWKRRPVTVIKNWNIVN